MKTLKRLLKKIFRPQQYYHECYRNLAIIEILSEIAGKEHKPIKEVAEGLGFDVDDLFII